MSDFALLARRYRHARSHAARKVVVRELRALGHFARLTSDDEAFAMLVGASTLGAGGTPEESPVQLMLLSTIGEYDLLTLAFQRYHTWAELLALRAHPLFPASADASLLDQHWFGDRPAVRFARWLATDSVDWTQTLDPAILAARAFKVCGPESPFRPTWLRDLDEFARRFRPDRRPHWLVRAAGLAGEHVWPLLGPETDGWPRAAFSELTELLSHPDAMIVAAAHTRLAGLQSRS